ncbi:MAG: hypothetical protein KGO22_20755, partial [Gammaproteobacteria bacterium]|nr:hypothetical protein [Gammaproteobacteria bacterium]
MTKSSGTILDGDSRPRRGEAQDGPSTKSSGTILDGDSRSAPIPTVVLGGTGYVAGELIRLL